MYGLKPAPFEDMNFSQPVEPLQKKGNRKGTASVVPYALTNDELYTLRKTNVFKGYGLSARTKRMQHRGLQPLRAHLLLA